MVSLSDALTARGIRMPYTFPKSILKDGRPLNQRELDTFLQGPANKVQGALNQHDIEQDACLGATVADGAYYEHHFIEHTVDPDFIGTGTPLPGGNGPDATVIVMNDSEWNVLDTFTSETTECMLWLIASAQFTYHDWTKAATEKTAIQFALRLDGQVLEQTITGLMETTRKAWAPFRVKTPKNTIGDRTYRYEEPHSIGGHHAPPRLSTAVPVSPGRHTIDLVVRRVATPDRFYWEQPDYIEVYNRRIYALEIPSIAQGSGAEPATVDCELLLEGEILSKASYETDRLDNVIGAYNSLTAGNLSNQSLNHHHLPSAVFASEQVVLDGTTNTITNEYKGWADITVGDPGWVEVTDGGGNPLRCTNGGGGFALPDYGDCWVLILGEIEVKRIVDGTDPGGKDDFGMFCFMRWDGAAWQLIGADGETEVSLSSDNNNAGVPHEAEHTISMVNVYHVDTPGYDIPRISMFGATWDGAGTSNTVAMTIRNGSIKVLIFRP